MAGPLREDRDARGVVTLTLDRPEVKNAFDPDLMDALTDAVTRLPGEDGVRVVVITGGGDVFSAGADLNWMRSMVAYTFEQNVTDSRRFEGMLRAVHDCPLPVVARVNGHALGGAAGLLGCVDVAVATRGALIGFTEARLGLVPAMISAYVLPRIGIANARRYFLTGERFDADTARRIGLVHEVVGAEDLDDTVTSVVDALLAAGPEAQREVKRLVAAIAAASTLDETEDHRLRSIAGRRTADEGQEGMRAFFERRRPTWVPQD